MRGRGLKPHGKDHGFLAEQVALHAGARIETPAALSAFANRESPSMRGRGLKLQRVHDLRVGFHVALHAGARIETRRPRSASGRRRVALHAGARIETV